MQIRNGRLSSRVWQMIFAPRTLLNGTGKGRRAMTSTPTQLNEWSRERLLSDPNLETPGDNSIHAYKSAPPHESNFHPVPVDQLLAKPLEEVEWVLEEYLPAGGLVLLVGKPKE